ncbi:hypothetical protein [Ornithinimicrobium faecis]|uniref:hypothetical protein n=1 Tax=Ornithinimicrobium faecis TaxID=2934158 RepID=UPI002117D683|nr:hypothetical protein [Ornithinimicrobium sp. HY1745]
MNDDLLTRAGRMLETASAIRQSDPTAAVSLASSAMVMAHVAVLKAHGRQPTPADERHLGKDVTALLGEPLTPEERLTALLDARDGVGVPVDAEVALNDARTALERARAGLQGRQRRIRNADQ